MRQKLGIKPGDQVLVIDAPRGFGRMLGRLPEGAVLRAAGRGPFRIVHAFVVSQPALRTAFAKAKRVMLQNGLLWISWPKRASGIDTELDENVIRAAGLASGLVDVKVCAVDAIWSGLKFVVPLKSRSS